MLALYKRYLDAKEKIKNMVKDDEGQTLVEYVLLIVLIALLVITAINPVTTGLQQAFSRIGASVTSTGS